MVMDAQSMVDRRRLRRKVTFWRVAAAVLAAALLAYFGSRFTDARLSPAAAPHIAQVRIEGLITDNTELLERLEAIKNSKAARGLIVTMNSPGGTTLGGEAIYEAIREIGQSRPVATEVRTLAASAGYMIAAASDRIVARNSSIVGSIGVIFQYPQVYEFLDQVGIDVEEIKSGPLKAEPSPFHEASEEAKAMIRDMVMDSYDWFVDLVAERREMKRGEVLRLADGSIFTGQQALENGLIDAIGDRDSIRRWMEEERGVDPGLAIVEWRQPEEFSWLSLGFVSRLAALVLGEDIDAAILRSIFKRPVFLDGLVSVWQFGGADGRAR